jgi:hypothetical protein
MFKKLLLGGVISVFMVTAAMPAFAASNCPLKKALNNGTNVSPASTQSVSPANIQQLLNTKKKNCPKKNLNQSNIQDLINRIMQSLQGA